jgi:glutathione S-transferase
MFEAAGQRYVDVGVERGSASVAAFIHEGGNTDVPVFAPPAIRNPSTNFVLYQTPTILRYLGKKFGMFPETEEMEAHADALMSFLTDFIAEGRLVFHPVCFTMSYYQQIEEAKPHIRWFETQRLPRFLTHLNNVLLHNRSAHPGSSVFAGSALTYVPSFRPPPQSARGGTGTLIEKL